jgi:hypothetical protein
MLHYEMYSQSHWRNSTFKLIENDRSNNFTIFERIEGKQS